MSQFRSGQGTVSVGALRRRIRIEQFTTSADGYGEEIKTWAVLDHVWAEVTPLRVSEQFQAQQVNRQVTHRVRIHYRSDITEQMRLVFDDDYYDIQGITEIGFRKGIELLCGLAKPEGA